MVNEITVTIVVLISTVGMILISNIRYQEGYKNGQSDALSGKQKYRLVEFEDGTREYRKESELKDLITHKIIK